MLSPLTRSPLHFCWPCQWISLLPIWERGWWGVIFRLLVRQYSYLSSFFPPPLSFPKKLFTKKSPEEIIFFRSIHYHSTRPRFNFFVCKYRRILYQEASSFPPFSSLVSSPLSLPWDPSVCAPIKNAFVLMLRQNREEIKGKRKQLPCSFDRGRRFGKRGEKSKQYAGQYFPTKKNIWRVGKAKLVKNTKTYKMIRKNSRDSARCILRNVDNRNALPTKNTFHPYPYTRYNNACMYALVLPKER